MLVVLEALDTSNYYVLHKNDDATVTYIINKQTKDRCFMGRGGDDKIFMYNIRTYILLQLY